MSSRATPPSAKKRQQAATRARNLRAAVQAREGLVAERAQQRQQEERARREESRLKSELKQYRRAFQSDTFSAPFGNTTVVGAPVPQNVDEFGADAGIDLTRIGARSSGTQTSPSIVAVQGARAALRGALQGQSIGGDDTTVLANQIRSPTVGRTLDFGESMIAGTPSPVVPSPYDFDLNDVTPPPDASGAGFSPGIQALAGFVRRVGVELDATGTPMSAAEVTHGAALDPVGDADSGNLAASGTDRDSTSHMDDILNALREITQLLQVTAGAQLVAQSQPVAQGSRLEFRRGFEPPEPHRGSDPSASDRLGELRARLDEIEQQFGRASEQYQTALAAYVEAVEDDIDSDEERPSNVTGLETESDDDFADMPTTPPAARDLAELLDAPAPAPAPAQAGSGAVAVSRQLDLEARAEAANALRRTPGIMKLIEARIFKFDDFLTNGSLDPQKLAKVRRVLAKRVDSSAESYKLAASARGYAPSGAAFPIEGLNNIVGGVRKVPGSKYVIYQGPQYVNG